MSEIKEEIGVSQEVTEKLCLLQPRCVVCGSTFGLQIHHRIFRSEVAIMAAFVRCMIALYKKSYGRDLEPWGLHDIQNLVRLCNNCHEGGSGRGVHGGNETLRQAMRFSFTCPQTGFIIPFFKPPNRLF